MRLACQEWPWMCFWEGQKLDYAGKIPDSMRETRDAGFSQWECGLPDGREALDLLGSQLKDSGLGLVSMYANVDMHTPASPAALDAVERRCRDAKALGLKVLVANPDTSAEEKTAQEIAAQQAAWTSLQRRLDSLGLRLAYHVHSADMRGGGREFTAMVDGIPSLELCMEAEWMLRGGWDAPRVLAFLKAHAGRVASLHLRQSVKGQHQLALGPGDLDYDSLAQSLAAAGFSGPATFEGYHQGAMELESMRQALKQSVAWAAACFKAI